MSKDPSKAVEAFNKALREALARSRKIVFLKIKKTLRGKQKRYFNSMRWLISGHNRQEGRTRVLAIAFIERAMICPMRAVIVFDHFSVDLRTIRYLMDMILDIGEENGLIFKCDVEKRSIMFVGEKEQEYNK